MTRVPVRQADIPADCLRLFAAGNGLDQGQRHRHGRGDPRRRRNALVNHQPPVRDIVDRGMLVAQLLDEIPVGSRPFAVQQPGLADDLGSGAHPDDHRALGRLALEPFENRRVVVAAHGRDDDIVGAFRMLRIELRDRRLRLDLERRIELHRPRLRCQQHHVGDVGAPKDAIGHEIVGDLGGVIDADDRNQRSLAFRRLQSRESRVGFLLRDRRRGRESRCRRERKNPCPANRRAERDCTQTAPEDEPPIHGTCADILQVRCRGTRHRASTFHAGLCAS